MLNRNNIVYGGLTGAVFGLAYPYLRAYWTGAAASPGIGEIAMFAAVGAIGGIAAFALRGSLGEDDR